MTNEEFIKSVSFEGEIWKDVVGYEGLYLVSNQGRVVSLQRKVNVGNGGWRILPTTLLKPYISKVGNYIRYCVSLWNKNRISLCFEKHCS